jgi:hypothetical protein
VTAEISPGPSFSKRGIARLERTEIVETSFGKNERFQDKVTNQCGALRRQPSCHHSDTQRYFDTISRLQKYRSAKSQRCSTQTSFTSIICAQGKSSQLIGTLSAPLYFAGTILQELMERKRVQT